MFVYESFARSRSRPARVIARWSKASFGQLVDRVPARVVGQLRVDAERDDAEVCGGELPFPGMAVGIAERLELLEVRDLLDVDLVREMPADRVLERLSRL